jgi:leader peptidase (prepilin peptidase) / N-methyltransferase
LSILLVAAAASWGLLAGLALSAAAYRLSVAPGEPWRPGERPGWRGWVGRGPGRSGVWQAAATAVVCGALAQVVAPRPELAVWLLLAPVAVVLTRVDLAVRRLPDVLTLPAAGGTAAALAVAALLPGHGGSWPGALLGGVALGAVYLALLLVNPAGIGLGDVKLAPTVGMVLGWYGWPVLFAGTCLGFVLGALTALVLLLTRRADRKTAIPFGPFMLLGAFGGVLLGAG